MLKSIPYVYLIGWSKHDRWYFGARWANGCHPSDLWISYFTSSRHVHDFVRQHGDPDIIEIRRTFEDVNTARLYEEKVLRRLGVLRNERWINRNVNGRFLHHGPQSKDHIAKRVAATTATKKKNGYRVSDQTKLKISNSIKGRSNPFTSEHKARLKCHVNNVQKVECPHCSKVGQLTNMKRWHFDKCKSRP